MAVPGVVAALIAGASSAGGAVVGAGMTSVLTSRRVAKERRELEAKSLSDHLEALETTMQLLASQFHLEAPGASRPHRS